MLRRFARSFGASAVVLLLLASAALAAMGDIAGFTFAGFGPSDAVGQGESSTPDGRPDARFSASITGAGALAGLQLRSLDGNGTWDTTPGNSSWGMQVKDNSGNLLTEASGRLPMVPFLLGLGIEFSVADNGAIARGGKFALTARFLDNSEATSTITIPPSVTPTTARLMTVRWVERGTRDLTGRYEAIQGDGRPDERIRLELEGAGTLVEAEVRNLVEGNPTAVWDTIPGNGRWAIAVVQGRNTLNNSDGSIEIPISGRTVLDLSITDNGSIADGRTRFEVILRFADGKRLRGTIAAQAAEPPVQLSERLQATMMGEGNRDLVGRNERRTGNGKTDWRIDVKLDSPGTLIGMKVANVRGPSGEWDTLPGNGKWLLAVTRTNGEILNRSDGAINIPISEPAAFILWLEDNDSLGKAETRSRLTLVYDDGRVLEEDIKPYTASAETGDGDFLDAVLSGVGSYDYVGKGENLSGNLNRDDRFDIRFTGKGTLTGIRLVNMTKGGEWDTIPNNGRWVLAATRPGGPVLNAPNGSIRVPVEGTTSLQLWVEDNGTLDDKASAFKISLAFSDGRLLEKEIPARLVGALPMIEKRELELSKPRQASSDYVGPYDRLLKNGKGDWVFTLKVKGRGTIKALSLRNIGVRGIWDTLPGNGRWTMAVRAAGGGMLSQANGSVSIPVPPNRSLYLFVENNGTLQLPQSRYELVATWDDGTTSSVQVP